MPGVIRSSSFVGRDAEVTRLVALVGDHRLVTVTGPGGVGKSRLVAHCRRQLEGTFGAGISAYSLAGLDAAAGADRICGQLGMASPEALAVSAGEGRALVILDDCEHATDALRGFVERLLVANDQLHVLLTSREPLDAADERTLVLNPLPLPVPTDPNVRRSPAVQLFVDRMEAAGAAWPDTPDTMAVVAELCRRVDALPLAIELAAARARSFAPKDLLDLMRHRLEALRTRTRNDADRHRSVHAAIATCPWPPSSPSRAPCSSGSVSSTVRSPSPTSPLWPVPVSRRSISPTCSAASSIGRSWWPSRRLVRADSACSSWCVTSPETNWSPRGNGRRPGSGFASDGGRGERDGPRGQNAVVAGPDRAHRRPDRQPDRVDRLVHPSRRLAGASLAMLVPLFAGVHSGRSGEICAAGRRILERWPTEAVPLVAEAHGLLSVGAAMAGDVDAACAHADIALDDPLATSIGRTFAARGLALAAIAAGDPALALRRAVNAREEAAAGGMSAFEREMIVFEAIFQHQCGQHAEAAVTVANAIRAVRRGA